MTLLPAYIADCSATRRIDTERRPHPLLRACAWALPLMVASVVTCAPASWAVREWHRKPPPVGCCTTPVVPELTNTSTTVQVRP